MTEKITIDHIIKEFEKEGYSLLTDRYINSKQKLDCVCPNGHKYSVSWNHWSSLRSRCKVCYRKLKVDIDDIRKSFASEGYVLLTKVYKNNHTKLEYICPKGHRHNITWGHWNTSKARCFYCSGNASPTLEELKKLLEDLGYTFISWPGRSKSKVKYMCNVGHINESLFYTLKKGHRCPTCSKNIKTELSFIKSEFEKEGYLLLTDFYTNNRGKLEYICPVGHKHTTRWFNWTQGRRCPTCKGINISITRSGPGHPNWQGGVSYEPYCPIWKDKEYKTSIKERDDYRCLNPLCGGKDDRLHIHHVDYNKKNCSPNNLITLCGSCNSKANYDREWHMSWYQALLYRKYNYIY